MKRLGLTIADMPEDVARSMLAVVQNEIDQIRRDALKVKDPILVIAYSAKAAYQWARENNLHPREIRYVATAEQLKGVQGLPVVEVHGHLLNPNSSEIHAELIRYRIREEMRNGE